MRRIIATRFSMEATISLTDVDVKNMWSHEKVIVTVTKYTNLKSLDSADVVHPRTSRDEINESTLEFDILELSHTYDMWAYSEVTSPRSRFFK